MFKSHLVLGGFFINSILTIERLNEINTKQSYNKTLNELKN